MTDQYASKLVTWIPQTELDKLYKLRSIDFKEDYSRTNLNVVWTKLTQCNKNSLVGLITERRAVKMNDLSIQITTKNRRMNR